MEANSLVLKKEFIKIERKYKDRGLDFQPYYQALRDSLHLLGNTQIISIQCNILPDDSFNWEFTFKGSTQEALNFLDDDDFLPTIDHHKDSFTINFNA